MVQPCNLENFKKIRVGMSPIVATISQKITIKTPYSIHQNLNQKYEQQIK